MPKFVGARIPIRERGFGSFLENKVKTQKNRDLITQIAIKL